MSDPLPDLPQTGQTPGADAGATTWPSITSVPPSGIARTFRKFIEPNMGEVKSLISRLAALAPGPQESESAWENNSTASEFSALVTQINQKKDKIGFLDILFIRLKTIFTRDSAENYDAEITKKAFSKIDQGQKEKFLQAAIDFIALQEEEGKAEQMQILLKLCHGDPEGEKSFVDFLIAKDPKQLAGLLMNDALPKLDLDKGQYYNLAWALAWSENDVVDLLKQLLDKRTDQCNNLAIALAGTGKEGVALLKQLLDPDKLKTAKWKPEQCNDLALELARNENGGVELLKELLDPDKLKIAKWKPEQCNNLAMRLAWNENGGVELLKELLEGDKLKTAKWEPDQCYDLALELARNENGGVELLKELLDPDKLKIAKWKPEQCNNLAMRLAWNENGGVELLKELLEGDKLKTAKWEPDQCYDLAMRLAYAKKECVALLTTLLDPDKLQIAKWKPDQCNDLAIALLDDRAGKEGVELLKQLLSGDGDKLQTNSWIADEHNNLAIALLDDKAGKEGVALLKQLLNENKLPKFQLQGENGYDASKKKALVLISAGEIAELRWLIPRS